MKAAEGSVYGAMAKAAAEVARGAAEGAPTSAGYPEDGYVARSLISRRHGPRGHMGVIERNVPESSNPPAKVTTAEGIAANEFDAYHAISSAVADSYNISEKRAEAMLGDWYDNGGSHEYRDLPVGGVQYAKREAPKSQPVSIALKVVKSGNRPVSRIIDNRTRFKPP
jgi:hypothetical protein